MTESTTLPPADRTEPEKTDTAPKLPSDKVDIPKSDADPAESGE